MSVLKESQLYLRFIRSYIILFILFGLIGFSVGFWLVIGIQPQYVAERFFEFSYNDQNAPQVEKQADEGVAVLRSSQLKEQLGLQSTIVSVYKPGPFAIKIQIKNQNAESSVNGINKLGVFFLQAYPVHEVGTQTLSPVYPNYIKYLGFGLVAGLFLAFITALAFSYFRNY